MKKYYQLIIRKILKEYRISKNIRQIDLAELLFCSDSYISKIENGLRKIDYNFATLIKKNLNLNFELDKDKIILYEGIFDNILEAYIDDDLLRVDKYGKLLLQHKNDILNSLCKYRYKIYTMVSSVYFNESNEVDFEIKDILNYLDEKDIWLYLCIISHYFCIKEDYVNAKKYIKMSFKIKNEKLFATSKYKLTKIFILNKEYQEAFEVCNQTIELLKKQNMKRKALFIKIYLFIIFLKNDEFGKEYIKAKNKVKLEDVVKQIISNYKGINNYDDFLDVILAVQGSSFPDIVPEEYFTYLLFIYLYNSYKYDKLHNKNSMEYSEMIEYFKNPYRLICTKGQNKINNDNIYSINILNYINSINTFLKYG